MKQVCVLGAGIAGISAAYHAQLKGFDVSIFEASSEAGGLVGNFEVNGFRFDKAVHLSFTKNEYVKNLFGQVEHYKHKPDSYCYDRGYWLKHPVQNNLYPLPLAEKIDLIESFTKRPESVPSNYQEWLVSQYGELIAEKYPISYTKKYWGTDASNLSLDWIGNRVRKADIKEVLSGALERRNENHYYANEMRYPKAGGYKAFVQSMLDKIYIQCNKVVIAIDPAVKSVSFSDGSTLTYENLVNTIPLPKLIPMIKGAPAEVLKAAKSLLYTKVDLISVGFSKPNIPPYLWFYIYGNENLAARGYSPSWKSPDNAPKGCSSLQFEIYSLSSDERLDPEELKKKYYSKLIIYEYMSRRGHTVYPS